jgi:hypothetical protein
MVFQNSISYSAGRLGVEHKSTIHVVIAVCCDGCPGPRHICPRLAKVV